MDKNKKHKDFVPHTKKDFFIDRTKALFSDIGFSVVAIIVAIVVSYLARGIMLTIN